MDYEKLIYTNENGGTIEFSNTSIYHVNVSKDVTGISDVRNTLYTTSSMGQHGETLISQKIDARDIEITGVIRKRSKDLILSRRREMQKILNPSLAAKLTYKYGDLTRIIDCQIDNAPVFFKKGVYQEFTVQLTCLSPFWQEEMEDKDEIATWIGAFEFPLEIPEGEGIEFGYRTENIIVDVYNDGDVETGMRVVFTAIGTLTNPILLNVNTQEYIKVNAVMEAGDVITINTEYGKKGATMQRSGVIYDYFRYVDVDSTFFQLKVGDNILRYDADMNADALNVTIYHANKYLGV